MYIKNFLIWKIENVNVEKQNAGPYTPEGSPFYNDNDSNVIASLEATFKEHYLIDLYFAMVVDLNARKRKLCDTSGFDNNIPELREFSDMFVDTFDIERRSCDSVTNKFGRTLLQFC